MRAHLTLGPKIFFEKTLAYTKYFCYNIHITKGNDLLNILLKQSGKSLEYARQIKILTTYFLFVILYT